MDKIKGSARVDMDIEIINEINALVDRDTAKAIRTKGDYGVNYCPECGKVVVKGYKFCPECGQRLDMDNIAF